jgi:hypothetical protein
MYQNPYMQGFNSQANIDRINAQMAELEKMKQQLQQPPQQQMPTSLTQNFQLAPTHQGGMRYANTIDDVGKEVVYADMPFFSKDMSVVWIKNNKGDIKTYELKEIVPRDEKDIKIDFLMAQIEELKKGMVKHESNANVDDTITEPIKDEVTTDVSTISKSTKKSK